MNHAIANGPYEIQLSDSERQFIQHHPQIRLGIDPEFVPFEFIDEQGQYSGIASDYIQLLNQRLGLHMQIIHQNNWKEAVELAKNRQLDVLPCVGITKEREKHFIYTHAYILFHRVVITRQDVDFVMNMDDISDLRVAVQANSSHEGYLKNYPNIAVQHFPNLRESLLAVANGQADAFVGNLSSSLYWIHKLNLSNLKVAGAVSHQAGSLHFAVRNDWPELATILNKGLASISLQEQKKISEKWVNVKYDLFNQALLWKVVIGFLTLILLVLIWNYKIRQQKNLAQAAREYAEKANAKLKRSHQKLHAIFDSAGAGIAVTQNRRIMSCNRRMDEIYGYDQGEQIGQLTRLWYPDDETYERNGKDVNQHVVRNETYINELPAVKKDGSPFWVRVRVHAIDCHDLHQGLVTVIEDVSAERENLEAMKKTQQQLSQANAQLRELDQLKSMFIASMSHELRTPLNSIIGFSGLLLQGVSGEINSEQRDDINRIYHSGKHLLELITDVIDISKIEAGRIDSYPQDIILNELITEAVQTIRPLQKKKNLQLTIDTDDHIQMHSDRKRILQCLLNLIGNAVKYSEHGTIAITASASHDQIVISISDTGIGIAEKDLPRLFEAFERLDSHLRVKAGGTGLGLYLTKKIVTTILNGNIEVQSQEGVGSQFTMTLARQIKGSEASA